MTKFIYKISQVFYYKYSKFLKYFFIKILLLVLELNTQKSNIKLFYKLRPFFVRKKII